MGRYEVIAPLGAGGMGEVYRARDTRLDREVAVKVLPQHLAGDPRALERFEREGKAVAALSHPNILVLFDIGAHDGIRYAVTELLEGETLRDRLSRAPLSWRKTIELGVALADGLAAAHSKDIVHRDIKPGNIFLTTGGQIKILDFGLARWQRETSPEDEVTRTETQAGTVMGSPGYMSPEQVRGEKAGAPRDIFSLGCVLYEAVTGRRAFPGKSAGETLAAILKDDPHAIRKLADALAVQNDIAHQIVEKLRLRLSNTQMAHMTKRQTANPEAYQLYLKGRYFAGQFSQESLDKGMNYFRQAIALDPTYALAYDGMSYYYTLIEDLTAAPADVMPKSEEAARRAMALDDSLVEPHVEQAFNYTCYDFDWPAAEREFQRALSLNPNYAAAHEFYSWYLISGGSSEKAIQEARRAVELDPLSAEIHSILGFVLYFAHRYDQAAVELHKTLELDPNYWIGCFFLGQVYAQQGRFDDAIAAQRKASESFGSAVSWSLAEIARDYALKGKLPEARRAIQDFLTRSRQIHGTPYGLAAVYVALGDKDQAFAQLEQAFAQRSEFMDFLKVDPELDSLRSDPRFQNLLGRMNLK